jgi:hypothetical protein
MLISLGFFFIGFLVQGLAIATIWSWFKKLSIKRRRKEITEFEKYQQAIVSLPAKPILETILRKDPVGMRVIYSICVINSTIIAVLFSSSYFIISFSLVILACVWLSLEK